MYLIKIRPLATLKKVMPSSLYGRSLLIIVMPLLLLLLSTGYIFYDRHTETVVRQISGTLANTISVFCDLEEQGLLTPQQLSKIAAKLEFSFTIHPRKPLTYSSSTEWLFSYVNKSFSSRLNRPYALHFTEDNIHVYVLLKKAVLQITFLKKRIFSRTTPLVLIWALITAFFVFFIASVFMRNQIKPIRKLADAADKFGRTGEIEKFKPEGAEEVRRAGIAFNLMRERLRRLLTERVDMLAGVSHDLRTPLTRMKLQLAMMPASTDVDLLNEDINQMHKMLQGYLDFAQGTGPETTQLTPIFSLIQESSSFLKDSMFRIKIKCDKNLEWMIKPDLFKRCLTNLLTNSKRYAVYVEVMAYTTASTLVIRIDDNGPGIPPDQRENVFRPFFRLEEARPLGKMAVWG